MPQLLIFPYESRASIMLLSDCPASRGTRTRQNAYLINNCPDAEFILFCFSCLLGPVAGLSLLGTPISDADETKHSISTTHSGTIFRRWFWRSPSSVSRAFMEGDFADLPCQFGWFRIHFFLWRQTRRDVALASSRDSSFCGIKACESSG